jgi:hypothetical protein
MTGLKFFFATAISLGFFTVPGALEASDDSPRKNLHNAHTKFEKLLLESLTLPPNSFINLKQCTLTFSTRYEDPCQNGERYRSTKRVIDFSEVSHVSMSSASDIYVIDIDFNKITTETLRAANTELENRTQDNLTGNFEGTPSVRYMKAQRIIQKHNIKSVYRALQCDGLSIISIKATISESLVVSNFKDDTIFKRLEELASICRTKDT